MDVLTLVMGVAAALVALLVLSRIVKVSLAVTGGVSFRDLRAVSAEAHERIGSHLRAHWSGDPAGLPAALAAVLPGVREAAARHRVALDDDVLRTLVATSVAAHRLASREQAAAAVDAALGRARDAA